MSLGMAHADGQYNVAMVKASNLDIVPPKEKHVRYLISWTNDYPAEDNLIAVFKSLCERLEEKVPASHRPGICGLRTLENCCMWSESIHECLLLAAGLVCARRPIRNSANPHVETQSAR